MIRLLFQMIRPGVYVKELGYHKMNSGKKILPVQFPLELADDARRQPAGKPFAGPAPLRPKVGGVLKGRFARYDPCADGFGCGQLDS
jgi:hypothetical protein